MEESRERVRGTNTGRRDYAPSLGKNPLKTAKAICFTVHAR